jgi:hypothetical protein
MVSPNNVPHPPEPAMAVLNASNLELLVASPHEKNRVQDFVTSQTRYANARANEGRAVRASWDIGTPEKEKMRLHHQHHQPPVGFETPVLRPRAAHTTRALAEPVHHDRPVSPARSKSPTNHLTQATQSPRRAAKKAKATPAVREAGSGSPKRQRLKGSAIIKSTAVKKSSTSNQARKGHHARSDTDEEHLASVSLLLSVFDGTPIFTDVIGLTERRERKRARREIMNSEVKTGARSEKENNKKDARNGSNEKKKQKIPAGLALMHGFSSTSVGKCRLTVAKKLTPELELFTLSKTCTD